MKKVIALILFHLLIQFTYFKGRRIRSQKSKKYEQQLNFIIGMGVGYGLKVEATEDFKQCFLKTEKSDQMLETFLEKTNTIQRTETQALESNNKGKQRLAAKSFTKAALEFFAKFKDCAPFRETFFSFVKTKLINVTVKGIAYAVGGVIGVLIKSAYDLIKLLTEIKNYYNISSKPPVDYFKLGSSIGKILYYTQNLALRKR